MTVYASGLIAKTRSWKRPDGRRLSHKPKVALMTPLADAILEAATAALDQSGGASSTESAAQARRAEARAVAIAVLVVIGGAKGKPGMLPFNNGISQKFLALADELDAEEE
jgi:hypothetical protein